MIVDIHVHTNLSDDSKTTPEKYVEAAIKSGAGLGAICFTEHRKFPRDPEIDRLYSELSDNHGILIIKGIEADTDLGHLLLFGLNDEVLRRFDPDPADAQERASDRCDLQGRRHRDPGASVSRFRLWRAPR